MKKNNDLNIKINIEEIKNKFTNKIKLKTDICINKKNNNELFVCFFAEYNGKKYGCKLSSSILGLVDNLDIMLEAASRAIKEKIKENE